MHFRVRTIVALAGIGLTAGVLSATALAQTASRQQPAPAESKTAREQPPVSANPTMTTAAFGDWVLRCVQVGAEENAKSCEVAQSILIQGQAAPLAQIAIGRASANEALKVTIALPNNVTLTSGPKVTTDDEDKRGVETAWQRCLPGGCFASAALGSDTLAAWRGTAKPGGIVFIDGTGQLLKLPVSFRGLQQALAQLRDN